MKRTRPRNQILKIEPMKIKASLQNEGTIVSRYQEKRSTIVILMKKMLLITRSSRQVNFFFQTK